MKFHTNTNKTTQIQSNQSNQEANVFTLTSHRIQMSKSQRKSIKKKCLRWNFQQNTMYLKFLKLYQKKLKSSKNTKKYKKFEKMSEFIGEKSAGQCRSHHQKMILRFGCINNIINQLSKELRQCFQQNFSIIQRETQMQIQKKTVQNKLDEQSKGQLQQTIEEQKLNMDPIFVGIQDENIFDVLNI